MNLLSSLRSRIFLTSALLAVLSIGVAIYLVSVRVAEDHENALQREIVATGKVVDQLRDTRAQHFTMMARLIAEAPTLKAAVDTADPPTVQDIADEYQTLLDTNLLLVTSAEATVLARVGVTEPIARAIAAQPAVREAIAGHESFSLLPQPEGMLQLVTVPIAIGLSEPDILGTVSVGFLLDDALARQTKEITGSEIAFGHDGQILASTLPDEDRPALAELLRRAAQGGQVTLRTEEFLALPLPLSTGAHPADPGSGPVALILRSRREQRLLLRTLHLELAGTAVAAMFVAMILGLVVARTITRPLASITDTMREVAATGDLTRTIALRGAGRWNDEDARLLANTFNTLTESVARFQREIAQRERLASLGRLSTVIAHEVRNPLMIIKAALHTLRQPPVSEAAMREAAADIDEEVARLNRVVNEVLDFARPIRFELAPADVNALCRDAAAAAQSAPGAPVEVDVEASPLPISTDAERLRVALINLIVNARQAVDAADATSDPRGRVFVAARRQGGRVAVTITDTGAGIDAADLPRVFDPYFTTKRGGTGLGLPIAKNIVEGLGGSVSVTSAPGRGTEIRIEMPVNRNG
jgi:signal transduction histidine kinase